MTDWVDNTVTEVDESTTDNTTPEHDSVTTEEKDVTKMNKFEKLSYNHKKAMEAKEAEIAEAQAKASKVDEALAEIEKIKAQAEREKAELQYWSEVVNSDAVRQMMETYSGMDYATAIKAAGLTPQPNGGTYQFTWTPVTWVDAEKNVYTVDELSVLRERDKTAYDAILDKQADGLVKIV